MLKYHRSEFTIIDRCWRKVLLPMQGRANEWLLECLKPAVKHGGKLAMALAVLAVLVGSIVKFTVL